jgi:MFS family permease
VDDSAQQKSGQTKKFSGALETLSTLKIAAFRFLIIGNIFSEFAFQTRQMAQAWLVLEMTDSDGWVGAANGIPAIPVILLSLFGGVLADRMDRVKLLIYTRVVFAFMGLLTAALISAGMLELWHLFVLATMIGVTQATGLTAAQAMLVDIAGRERIFSANAMFGVSFNLATFVGPAVGGLVIASLGVDAAFYLMAVMLVISVGFVSLVKTNQTMNTGEKKSVMVDLREGIVYVWSDPALRWTLLLGFMLIFAAMHFTLLPRYSRDVLNAGAGGFGTLLAAQGLGGIAGTVSLIASGSVRQLARVLVIVTWVFLGCMVLLALSTNLWLSSLAMFGTGFVIVWWGNSLRTLFQLQAADHMRGRVMGIFSLIGQMIALSWLAGGLLSELIGMRPTMVTGISIATAVYLFAYLRSPELRAIGSETEPES